MAVTQFTGWDFYNNHIEQDVMGGQYIAADSTLIGAGPPRLSDTPKLSEEEKQGKDEAEQAKALSDKVIGEGSGVLGGKVWGVYPIGLLETFGLQQSRQLQRLFEIGSSRSYFVPGRTIGSVTLGRTFYFGPSLLRCLYAYYYSKPTSGFADGIGVTPAGTKVQVAGETGLMPDPLASLIEGGGTKAKSKESLEAPDTTALNIQKGLHQVQSPPGADYLYINLASDLFAQPTGLAVYFKDQNSTSLAAFYLEFCYVQGHQLSISAGSILVMEGASLQYDTLKPIKMMTGVT